MNATKSDSGVKAVNQKVVVEMLSIINSKGKFSEKKKLLWKVKTDGRPGKDLSEKLRIDYIHKFDFYTERNILGRYPRGLEAYGYNIKKQYGSMVWVPKKSWEERFCDHLESLYSPLYRTLQVSFNSYKFIGQRKNANKIRKEHIERVKSLQPDSDRLFAEHNERIAKQNATKLNPKSQQYIISNFPYREATGKWAGGETTVNVYTRTGYACEANGSSSTAWSSNGKWKGLNAEYKFYFQEDETLLVIGGLATVYKTKDEKDLFVSASDYVQILADSIAKYLPEKLFTLGTVFVTVSFLQMVVKGFETGKFVFVKFQHIQSSKFSTAGQRCRSPAW